MAVLPHSGELFLVFYSGSVEHLSSIYMYSAVGNTIFGLHRRRSKTHK